MSALGDLPSNEQWGGVEKLAQQRNDALASVERLQKDHDQYVAWASPQLERLGREMADNERLRAALARYGHHIHPNCHDLTLKEDGSFGPRNGCLCGFDAVSGDSSAPPETKAPDRIKLKLAKDVYDDGEDHHPPGHIGHKGDVVYLHSIQTAVVSHKGSGHGFVVHDGELDLSSTVETSVGVHS